MENFIDSDKASKWLYSNLDECIDMTEAEIFSLDICEPDSVDELLKQIWAIGCDYDGCNDVDSLKKLVDELVEISQKARDCLRDGNLF